MTLTSFNREDAAINGNTPGDFRKSSTALSLIAGVNQAKRFALIGAVEPFMPSQLPKLVPVTPDSFALVDEGDYEMVMQWTWGMNPRYPQTKSHPRQLMHRIIMGAGDHQQVDHINHNCLDNRRCNLRFTTQAENVRGSIPQRFAKPGRVKASQFKGVTWRSPDQRWIGQIGTSANHTRLFLGSFASEVEAAIAYNHAAIIKFGEFAFLNIINPDGQTPAEIYGVDTAHVRCRLCRRLLNEP